MARKDVLKLTAEERAELERIAKGTRGGQSIAAWKVQRARALLKCDQGEHGPGWPDHRVAAAVEVTERSIQNWRKQAVLEGPRSVLRRKERSRLPTPRNPAIDWANQVQALVDDPRYADVERITLVCDNLNTPDIGSLYEAFDLRKRRGWWRSWNSFTRRNVGANSTWRKWS